MKRNLTIIICLLSLSLLTGIQHNHASDIDKNFSESAIILLNKKIPILMKKHNIPGLSMAYIENGNIIWLKGFGVKNSWSKEPVTEKTVFEGASFSKPLTAYGILLLEQRKKLSINDTINGFPGKYSFKPQKLYSKITIKHLLSHTSGLSNNMIWENKTVHFEPGSRFSYSGLGYRTLGDIIESVSGTNFNEFMTQEVFNKLKMNSSSYIYKDIYMGNIANGHSSNIILPLIVLAVFLVSALLVFGAGHFFMIRKFSTESFIPRAVLSGVSAIIVFFITVSSIKTNMILSLIAISAGIVIVLFVENLLSLIIKKAFVKKIVVQQCIFVCIIFLCYIIFANFSLPSPLRQYKIANGAATIYTTPEDISKFMIEIMVPKVLKKEFVEKMLKPHISISPRITWGLGIGLLKNQGNQFFWHWGHQPDYQNLFVGDIENKRGVVIMTNSTTGLRAVKEIAEIALGGNHIHYGSNMPFIFFSL